MAYDRRKLFGLMMTQLCGAGLMVIAMGISYYKWREMKLDLELTIFTAGCFLVGILILICAHHLARPIWRAREYAQMKRWH